MSSMLGPAPIVDFDGTLARLDVPWAELRASLGVERIDDLWALDTPSAWNIITSAERDAAAASDPVDEVVQLLENATTVAVLTSNAEDAVHTFLARFPALRAKIAIVVGRETLSGPKTNFETFSTGYGTCVRATAVARDAQPVVYVGDMEYELAFARRLGALTFDVHALERP